MRHLLVYYFLVAIRFLPEFKISCKSFTSVHSGLALTIPNRTYQAVLRSLALMPIDLKLHTSRMLRKLAFGWNSPTAVIKLTWILANIKWIFLYSVFLTAELASNIISHATINSVELKKKKEKAPGYSWTSLSWPCKCTSALKYLTQVRRWLRGSLQPPLVFVYPGDS